MKRSIRKICCVLLALTFVVSGVLSMAISANAAGLEDNLVVHYDFNGATQEEALKDKAPGGTVKDDLVIGTGDTAAGTLAFNSATGTVSIVTLTGKCSTLLGAASSDDMKALDGTSTNYIRFKLPESIPEKTTYMPYCTWVDGNARHAYLRYEPDTKNFRLGIHSDETGKKGHIEAAYEAADNTKFFDVAVTYTSVGDKKTDVAVYVSQGEEWTLLMSKTVTNMAVSGTYRIFDNAFGDQARVGLIIDDIRVYNIALTGEQLASEIGGTYTVPAPDTEADTEESTETTADTAPDTAPETAVDTKPSGFTGPAKEETEDTDTEAVSSTDNIEDTQSEVAEQEKKGGCGAVFGGSALLIIGGIVFACAGISKKRK